MLENLNATLSRIDEIKSHFQTASTNRVVSIAPHAYAQDSKTSESGLKPFFPDYLAKAVKEKVKGSVETVSKYDGLIESAAKNNGIDPNLLKAVIHAESGFNTNAVSAAGAEGLMQLMPKTAASLGVSDPFDPEQSINAGAKYIKQDLDRFGGNESLALAAYNAGAGAVVKYGGVPPYRETQNYVKKVLAYRDSLLSR